MMQSTQQPSDQAIRIVQLTDPHLGSDIDYRQSGINTYDSLRETLSAIKKTINPELVVATGDISGDGYPESYELFQKVLLEAQIDFCWLPGNHDNKQLMDQVFKKAPFRLTVEVGQWNLMMLNTSEYNRVGGQVPQEVMEQLASALEESPSRPTLVFTHHPAIDLGCTWLDRQKIRNGDELLGILGPQDNVKALLSGHVHQEYSGKSPEGIPIYSTPSTCFQFKPRSRDFALDGLPPGYRWIDLYPDGQFQTGVNYLESFAQTVDKSCVGY